MKEEKLTGIRCEQFELGVWPTKRESYISNTRMQGRAGGQFRKTKRVFRICKEAPWFANATFSQLVFGWSRKYFISKLSIRVLYNLLILVFIPVSSLNADPVSVLGDYAAEIRTGQHVDIHKMVSRLSQLHANTYMWLIWRSPHDWADLKEFLPLAEKAEIDVWAYLVPHSETPEKDPSYPYSEPFKLDYVRWAQEVAKLSLEHKNLVGYVIDDFWENVRPGRFTSEYTKQMVSAGKTINPKIKFYPLMYFGEIDTQFMELFADLVDGVVAAYPMNQEDIERALSFLNDDYKLPPNVEISYPRDTTSYLGDGGFVTQVVTIDDAKRASIAFGYQDDYNWSTEGYHFMQLRINDKVVWEEDVAGHDAGVVSIDISKVVVEGGAIKIGFGVFEKKGVSNFDIRLKFFDIGATGIRIKDFSILDKDVWNKEISGSFLVQFHPLSVGKDRYQLPMIVMPAGSQSQFEKRYEQKGLPQNILKKLKMSLGLALEGKVEGVVTFSLDKQKDSKEFDLIGNEYKNLVGNELR